MSVSGTNLQRAAAIAQAQRGRVTRSQLLVAGVHRGAITRMIRAGLLVPAHRGVYTFGLHTPTAFGAETAALLACREGAVLSHSSAAIVWEVWPADERPHRYVHVTVAGAPVGRQAGILGHRSRRVTRKDVRWRRGLPVTSPARTLLDLGPLLSARELEHLFDEFLIKRVIRPGDLADILNRCGQHPGRRALNNLADAYNDTGFTRSKAERLFRELIREARLPEPQTNVRLHGYEVDAYWPQQRLAVEVDGYTFHRTRRAFENDRRKSAHLQAEGIANMRVTWLQLANESMATIAAVARALGTAS
ncbi:MAG: type IV toxin-antitoxin system AbiEi family antitoxin domain-containing protein [Solirubrobacteraceae bacterium]